MKQLVIEIVRSLGGWGLTDVVLAVLAAILAAAVGTYVRFLVSGFLTRRQRARDAKRQKKLEAEQERNRKSQKAQRDKQRAEEAVAKSREEEADRLKKLQEDAIAKARYADTIRGVFFSMVETRTNSLIDAQSSFGQHETVFDRSGRLFWSDLKVMLPAIRRAEDSGHMAGSLSQSIRDEAPDFNFEDDLEAAISSTWFYSGMIHYIVFLSDYAYNYKHFGFSEQRIYESDLDSQHDYLEGYAADLDPYSEGRRHYKGVVLSALQENMNAIQVAENYVLIADILNLEDRSVHRLRSFIGSFRKSNQSFTSKIVGV